jgi:hypothetical protein
MRSVNGAGSFHLSPMGIGPAEPVVRKCILTFVECTLNLIGQAFAALWQKNSDCDTPEREGTLAAMIDIKPRDALKGMLIGQAIASHNAAMECYRRAMIYEQTFEGRRENLNQANKLSRTFASLTEALDRHRGKGQQRITVEHVNVHPGGQAIVGAVTARRGSSPKSKEQSGAMREITHEPSTPCGARTRSGKFKNRRRNVAIVS